jgi:hypothetical protein
MPDSKTGGFMIEAFIGLMVQSLFWIATAIVLYLVFPALFGWLGVVFLAEKFRSVETASGIDYWIFNVLFNIVVSILITSISLWLGQFEYFALLLGNVWWGPFVLAAIFCALGQSWAWLDIGSIQWRERKLK